MKRIQLEKSLCVFALYLVFLSCNTRETNEGEIAIGVMEISMTDSWIFGSQIDFPNLRVHDFSSSSSLEHLMVDDALFFLFPQDTCKPCLEREFQKFLVWDIPVDKYILGIELNSNYLLQLQKENPSIKGVLMAKDEQLLAETVNLPYIVFYRHAAGTSIIYAAVKSETNHFELFKSAVSSLTKQKK